MQTISGVIDRGLGIRDAVAIPRIHALAGGRVWLESPAATDGLLDRLSQRFADTKIKPALSFKMGAVQAIQFGADGSVCGAADPRRDGIAASLAANGSWI